VLRALSAEDLIEDGKFIAVALGPDWDRGVVSLKAAEWKKLGFKDGDDHIRVVVALGFFHNSRTKEKDSNHILLSWAASLSRDGRISPVEGAAPIIADEFYDDSAKKRLALASRAAAKRFLEERPCPSPEDGWPALLQYARDYYRAACRNGVLLDGKGPTTRIYAEPEEGDAKIANLLRLYDDLEDLNGDETALYDALITPRSSSLVPSDADLRDVAHGNEAFHCAHVDPRYGLDPDQRRAVRSLLSSTTPSIVAVNGPPGTGKTSMLKGVIASVWIAPLLQKDFPEPPLIIATAATNQAVTNIIAGLGDTARGNDPFEKRWLLGVNGEEIAPSYGWFFASKTSASKYPRFMQLTLEKGFPRLYADKAGSGVDGSDQALVSQYVKAYAAATLTPIGVHKKEYIRKTILRALLEKIRELWANERRLYEEAVAFDRNPSDLHKSALVNGINAAAKECATAGSVDGRATLTTLVAAINDRDAGFWEAYECFVDTAYRRRLFAIGARYWEGRFIVGERGDTRPDTVRYYAMVAPVVVATCHTLPKLLFDYDKQEKVNHPRFGYADLLIVDEAGQANPPLIAGLFGLARKALVVGDVEQLEPVLKLLESEDDMLLRSAGLDSAGSSVQPLKASQGNVMRLAQAASAFKEESGPGLTLRRHYRCVPDIIDFCNRNVYGGDLRCIRRNDSKPLYGKHLLFVRSDEGGYQSSGSWVNDREAEAIASWLVRERGNIEAWAKRTNRDGDLADIVGIITPYEPQEWKLRHAIEAAFSAAAATEDRRASDAAMVERMTIGTVHKLQGAERPIIIFSGTSDNAKSRPYYDKDRRLLNVAVSRAKDTFVLFGESQTFFEAPGDGDGTRGTSLLGRHVLARGKRLFPRNVVVVESTNKTRKIQRYLGVDYLVLHSGGHIRKLKTGRRGVDVDRGFAPEYEELAEGTRLLDRVRRELPEIDRLILATDADREGDHIAQAIVEALAGDDTSHVTVQRVHLEAVNRAAVSRAFGRPAELDRQSAVAARTREILDYLIGHLIPTVLQNDEDVRGSSGRVQAAALALLMGREQARRIRGQRYRLTLGDPDSADRTTLAELILPAGVSPPLEGTRFGRVAVECRELRLPSAPASTTVEVLRRASSELGLSPTATMAALQELFEGPREIVVNASHPADPQTELPL